MLIPEIMPSLERLVTAGAFRAPMLMLGAQTSIMPQWPKARDFFVHVTGGEYLELDLDGGDLRLDLNHDLFELAGEFATVCNLGTLEHVWDVHRAWSNALRAVAVGGTFVTHSPIDGWRDHESGALNHGLHQTVPEAILCFIAKNGFVIDHHWTTRFRTRGSILWACATKRRDIADLAWFEPVMQVYEGGSRPGDVT